jgi:ferritin-like metal-binding protein YciE
MYDSEMQIINTLPSLIKLVSEPDLKDALTKHLKETQNQVKRIEKVFNFLNVVPERIKCDAMQGILAEGHEITENKTKSPVLDAAIISACQKVEHYEIASYETLKSFAKHLDLDSEVVDLLNETLSEESGASKKLTKIAEGSFFSSGVNDEAIQEQKDRRKTQTKMKQKF